jgi:hypothetical protein
VDRDRHPRREEHGGLRGTLRVHVAGADARSPAPDRQQRDVEVAGEVGHAVEDVRVAEEDDPRCAVDEEPDRRLRRPERHAAAVVGGRRDHDLRRPDRHDVAGGDLDDLVIGRAPHDARGTGRRDDRDVGGHPSERPDVEMVVMGVGDQHRVATEVAGRRWRNPPDVADPLRQHGVGEQPRATHLEQRGRVAEVGDGVAAGHQPSFARARGMPAPR